MFNRHSFGYNNVRIFALGFLSAILFMSMAADAAQNTPPAVDPVQEVVINAGAIPVQIDLDDLFCDQEDGPESLTYRVVKSTNPAIFSSVDTDTGVLTLTFEDTLEAQGDIVVEAHDAQGLSAKTVIPVLATSLAELKAFADITVDTTANESVIDLLDAFSGADLVYDVIEVTNESIFDDIIIDDDEATLTLIYSGRPGTSTVTVQAEDLEDNVQQDSFTVTVRPAPLDVDLLLTAVEAALAAFSAASFRYGEVDFGYGGGDPCFIATAAYGTPLNEDINILRRFRDSALLTNPAGTALTDIYYRISPPIATVVARHPVLAAGIRIMLAPVFRVLAKPEYPVALGMLVVGALGWYAYRTNSRRVKTLQPRGAYPVH